MPRELPKLRAGATGSRVARHAAQRPCGTRSRHVRGDLAALWNMLSCSAVLVAPSSQPAAASRGGASRGTARTVATRNLRAARSREQIACPHAPRVRASRRRAARRRPPDSGCASLRGCRAAVLPCKASRSRPRAAMDHARAAHREPRTTRGSSSAAQRARARDRGRESAAAKHAGLLCPVQRTVRVREMALPNFACMPGYPRPDNVHAHRQKMPASRPRPVGSRLRGAAFQRLDASSHESVC